ncbi:MAG: MBL fold metallo-hydrolase [Treponema sp.]|jgi:glyoxylase-like metal-dependent hydrolase (beta-lactamase superfamily II)|nr:MBL fold metallo-hydrolase [Treponema sp.]
MREQLIRRITVGDIATNCWIYGIDDACALIDPGAEADRIIAALERLNMRPLYILLTHGHFDHIAALPALAAHYGKTTGAETDSAKTGNAPVIAVHRPDAEYFGPASLEVHRHSFAAAAGNAAYVDALWNGMPEPDRLLEDGDEIGPFTVLSLPGHTRGSAAFYDRSGGVLFSGDTLFRGGYGRTDLPGGNSAGIRQSLKKLLAMDKNIRVYPGHGPETTIGRETSLLQDMP